MIVMKFGGSSVADADRIGGVAEIVRARLGRRPLVVVSALGGVTDLLVQAVSAACRDDLEGLEGILAELERRHRWALSGSVQAPRQRHHLNLEVDALFEELRQKLRSIRILGEGTPRSADAVLACGETLSARIVASAFTAHGLPAVCVDPREVMLTDESFGEAEPLLEGVRSRCVETLEPLLGSGEVPILGGFVGAAETGETTTLGRGGSDTSAAVLGAVLGAEEIQIWTDVDGLMSADPRLVPEARPIARVSFAEAAELAFYGAKVLHPDSIAPAVQRGIPVRVLNSLRPDGTGTVIRDSSDGAARASVVSIASRAGVRSVRVSNRRMRADADFAAGVLDELRSRRIAPDLAVMTEVGVHLVLPADVDPAWIATALAPYGEVESHDDRAIVCVVGASLRQGRARRRAIEALAEWEPELLGVGLSATSVAAVLPLVRLQAAVRGLHRRFLEEARAH